MLFILRQLRRLEIRKRSAQYFLYAFGEIVLIVMGIMIAMQINSWSRYRSDRALERNFLHRFQIDLQDDLANFGEEVEICQRGLEAVKEAVALLHSENVEEDFYKLNLLYDLAYIDSFNPQYTTYEELESTGQLSLIRDESLRLAIQKLYAYYNRMEVGFDHIFIWRKNTTNGYDSETANLQYTEWNRDIFPPKTRSESEWAFLNDTEHPSFIKTETALAATSFWLTWASSDYEKIIPQTQALRDQIDEALETL